jgi:hypothetical protein
MAASDRGGDDRFRLDASRDRHVGRAGDRAARGSATISCVWKRGAEPGLLSEAINRHMAFGRDTSPVPLTEEELTFRCDRCGRQIPALDAVIRRTPREVAYECPHDAASFVTIHDQDYSFSEGELTIRVGNHQLDWWDFVNQDDDEPST